MQFKHLTLIGLAGYATAQSATDLATTLSSTPSLSSLTSLLNSNPALVEALSSAQNITILAPSNDAFAELTNSSAGEALATDPGLVTAILQYHVLNGSFTSEQITNSSVFVPTLLQNQTYTNVTGGQVVQAVKVGDDVVFYSGLLENSTVTTADVAFTGGVIHIVDRVLTLPASVLDTASASGLTSLRGAVNATGLIGTVNDTPDLTIFAPTNEAFRSISGALGGLSTEDLTNILSYHVVSAGSVGYSSTLENGTILQTASGSNLTITIQNGTVFVNAARVITPNVLVANGVVHVIDNVLNPGNTAAANATATSGAPAYTATTTGTEDPFTSGQPGPTTTSEGASPTSSEVSGVSAGAAMPMMTGSIGYGALLGAGAAVMGGLI